MKKMPVRKLTLRRDTLDLLDRRDLTTVAAGEPPVTAGDVCTLGCAATDWC